MNRPILPVGKNPSWELEINDDNGASALKSIAQSRIILQSLRQSRERWLSTFTKFSSKARGGKPSDIVTPPHTIQTRGKCDLEIGPHIFPDTTFYEVHYLPSQTPTIPKSTPNHVYQAPVPSGGSWQATTPYGSSYTPYGKRPTEAKSAAGPPSEPASTQKSSTPLLSSLTTVTTITPTLINQVNAAASSNPTLANLLQLAAAGKANPEQLKTLGLLIQSLATPESTTPILPGPASPTTPQSLQNIPPSSTPGSQPVKEFDVVIEFNETSHERWVFPRGSVVCERLTDSQSADASYDILVTTSVPFIASPTGAGSSVAMTPEKGNSTPNTPVTPQVVTFRLRKAPLAVWDTVSRWVGGEEKMKLNLKVLEGLKVPDRLYLRYQLPEGPLLTQLHTVTTPIFNMKSIKPGLTTTPRQKRKTTQRKSTDGATSRKKTADWKEPSTATGSAPPAKRKRISQSKTLPAVNQIACITCGQTDVPLILGGRYCRACVDQARGSPTTGMVEIPHAYKFSSYIPSGSSTPSAQAQKSANIQHGPSTTPSFAPSPLATNTPIDPTEPSTDVK